MIIPIQSAEDVIIATFISKLEQAFIDNHFNLPEEKWAHLQVCLREALDIKE